MGDFTKSQFQTRTEIVNALERHFHLVNLLVEEMTRYKRLVGSRGASSLLMRCPI